MTSQYSIPLPPDTATIPTAHGAFKIFIRPSQQLKNQSYVVFVNPKLRENKPPLVRIHSECFTGDTLASLRCDCHAQLNKALRQIGRQGGVLIYLRQEGRGIGLAKKIQAYILQERGLDTVEANQKLHLPVDDRAYDDAAATLKELRISAVRLLTNNPAKVKGLKKCGIKIIARIAIEMRPNRFNHKYLKTKKTKLKHYLRGVDK